MKRLISKDKATIEEYLSSLDNMTYNELYNIWTFSDSDSPYIKEKQVRDKLINLLVQKEDEREYFDGTF